MYQHYAAKRLLPARRNELHLAQISMLIAKTMGGAKDVGLADFLFEEMPIDEIAEADVASFFGFDPVNKKEE